MSKTQKILLTIALAVILVFAYTVNVSATDYSLENGVWDNNTTIILTKDDTFKVDNMSENLVGGIITLTSGTITIVKTENNDKLNLTITLGDESEATVNAEKVANLDNDSIAKLEIVINQSATLNIKGTLVIPSIEGYNIITNNGTINIEEEGALEIRKGVTYNAGGNGTINVYGTLAIFGEKITLGTVNLYEGGEIYSYTDIKGSVTVAETDNENYKYSLDSSVDTYISNALTGGDPVTLSNAYFYELTKSASNVGTDDTNSTTGDNVTTDDNDGEVTETVEETTETVEEATETEDETTSNPETGDSIMVFAVVFVVAIAGIVVTIKMRKRIK